MPAPVIAGLFSLLNTRLVTVGAAFVLGSYWDTIKNAVSDWIASDSGAAYVTALVNSRLENRGVDFRFSNVLDPQAMRADVDAYAAQRLNVRAGTSFTSLANVTRDEVLEQVGAVLAARVNHETGSNLAALWPVERLREELGTELLRQFDSNVDLPNGALFPRHRVEQIQAAIGRRLGKYQAPTVGPWGPPRDESHELQRAKARARQAKYRRTHRAVWVPI
ncbi:MAG: hypothetical protein N2483_10965 [Burkholderiaceae bacterium]|nr:hypothetical protein [Burkholderiaceae bacterium]